MATHDPTAFSDLLRHRRREAGLTQEALAECAGISVRTIADLERGAIRAPRRDTMEMLANALALPPEVYAEWDALRRQLSLRRNPASLASPATGYPLPQPANALVGRQHEIDTLSLLLTEPKVQLVTVTGPGGVGKTRLALATAASVETAFRDGVRVIELAAIRDPGQLLPVIARNLGVQPDGQRALDDLLTAFLASYELLLVLDNFEHLLDAAVHLPLLLASAPHLTMLVTSRARLQLQAEHPFPLAPLGVPTWDSILSTDRLDRYAATELFIQRSQQVEPEFAVTADNASAIASICSHLDGLPLAIELAAARTKVLTPQEMLPRLVNRLAFLTGGLRDAPDRHRTMRGAIAWNYDLLTHDEQRLFHHLSVCIGGWSLDAAEAITLVDVDAIDALATLIDHSLVTHSADADGRSRFSMLETIREYGLEQLEQSDEASVIRNRHANWYANLVDEAALHLDRPDPAAWIRALDIDHGNIVSALDWLARQQDAERGLRMVGSLREYWSRSARLAEGKARIDAFLALPDASAHASARARALGALAWIESILGNLRRSIVLATDALAVWEEIGDHTHVARLYNTMGLVAAEAEGMAQAREYWRRGLEFAREGDDAQILSRILHNLGTAAYDLGDLDLAQTFLDESLAVATASGDTDAVSLGRHALGRRAFYQRQYAEATAQFRQSLELYQEIDFAWGMARAVGKLAMVAQSNGDSLHAARLFAACEAVHERIRAPMYRIQREDHEPLIAAARDTLGEDAFERAWAEGRTLTLEQAIEEARAVSVAPDAPA